MEMKILITGSVILIGTTFIDVFLYFLFVTVNFDKLKVDEDLNIYEYIYFDFSGGFCMGKIVKFWLEPFN